jgi:hypothetical protein
LEDLEGGREITLRSFRIGCEDERRLWIGFSGGLWNWYRREDSW